MKKVLLSVAVVGALLLGGVSKSEASSFEEWTKRVEVATQKEKILKYVNRDFLKDYSHFKYFVNFYEFAGYTFNNEGEIVGNFVEMIWGTNVQIKPNDLQGFFYVGDKVIIITAYDEMKKGIKYVAVDKMENIQEYNELYKANLK